jgi:hypothetical protein
MPEKKEAAADEAGIEERIRALDRMTTGELADEYERLHRRGCRTRHRAYLIRRTTSTSPRDAGHPHGSDRRPTTVDCPSGRPRIRQPQPHSFRLRAPRRFIS